MPYKTRADKDRELWITPKEAVAHVCEVEHCPAKEARKQIINALKDEEIEARWPDFDPNFPKDPGDIYRQELDKFSDWAQGKYIGYTIVNWNPGAALYYNPDRNRRTSWFDLRAAKVRPEVVCRGLPLLFLKQNVMRLWPTKGSTTSDTPPLVVTSKTPKSPSDRILKIKQVAATKALKIKDAAESIIGKGRTPATCGSWVIFCREVRKALEVTETTRGYSNITIQNLARPLLKGQTT